MQIVHPISNTAIDGMELAAGAVLKETDVYDSTTGRWEPIPPGIVEMTLRVRHAAKFVRPRGELSDAGKGVLAYLARWNLCLTERAWWVAIPSPHHKNDGRMDW